MATAYDFTKLRRLLTIHLVVQICLVLMLVTVSLTFQQKIADRFLNCVIFSLLIQVGLFFPLKNLTAREVNREIGSSALGLTLDDLKSLRKKRVIADILKSSVFLFFIVFIYRLPGQPVVLAIAFLTFILTCLSYFQCFNYWARREMKINGGK
jgi:uncharacterized membrane protein YhaH (DUF805 family)